MPETDFNLPDVIAEIFRENKKSFMTLKQAVFHMPAQAKREAGIFGLTNAAEIQKIIEPQLENKYVFHRRGTFIFILEPKAHEEFILDTLEKRAQTPKNIARFTPFSKKECSELIAELVNQGRLTVKVDDDLQARIYPNKNQNAPAPSQQPEVQNEKDEKIEKQESPERNEKNEKNEGHEKNTKYAEYTVENFRNAFHSLDNGRIFVKISDLRKTLGWPRNIFDSALKQLRDVSLIQLHTGDASLMTPEEINDCFVDENNFRMGTVTWHGR